MTNKNTTTKKCPCGKRARSTGLCAKHDAIAIGEGYKQNKKDQTIRLAQEKKWGFSFKF
jgi:hypothetical protein